jgi:RimJ/RimL family protein N-acetyltransferase
MDYFLKSDRLGFRCWSNDDLPLATELWRDPGVTALIGGPFKPDMVEARLAHEIALMQNYSVQYWPIFLLHDNQFVGCTGLKLYKIEDRVYEIGFHLLSKFWRQGLATEAAKVVIEYGFGQLDAKAIFAGHHPANHASRKVLLKLSFVHTHDEPYPLTGLQHPSYLLRRTS